MTQQATLALAGLVVFGCSADGSEAAAGSETQASSGAANSEGETQDDSSPGSGGATSSTGDIDTSDTITDTSDHGTSSEESGDGSESGADETTGDSTTGETTAGADDSNALHVSESGQDSNPGTPQEPMRTIQWAIGQAEMDPEIDTIRVATGTYGADVANDAIIVLVDGVSLLGGWNEGFDSRDPLAWPSHIVDSSDETPAGTSTNSPARVVEVPSDVTAQTRFDGFHVQVGRGQDRTGIYIEGDATISANTFDRGADGNGTLGKSAIRINGGSPQISGNHIDLEYEAAPGSLHGIRVLGGNPVIFNNVITLHGVIAIHYGIEVTDASPDIIGNSIEIHGVTYARVIMVNGNSQPRIDNNVLQSNAGTCVSYYLNNGTTPGGLHNNLLQCPLTVSGTSLSLTLTTIAEVHAELEDASGNVKLPGPLVDAENDLRLDENAPCTVARGGLDLPGELSEDFAGQPRTAPMSMGAHEWDGDCQ
ncbi:MAG: DUF1565 domain-containing protein, partial [Nannocystaceae bacterium]|nr:DUF1565 domain-containing protein [Nannocystaceae bacterium]